MAKPTNFARIAECLAILADSCAIDPANRAKFNAHIAVLEKEKERTSFDAAADALKNAKKKEGK